MVIMHRLSTVGATTTADVGTAVVDDATLTVGITFVFGIVLIAGVTILAIGLFNANTIALKKIKLNKQIKKAVLTNFII